VLAQPKALVLSVDGRHDGGRVDTEAGMKMGAGMAAAAALALMVSSGRSAAASEFIAAPPPTAANAFWDGIDSFLSGRSTAYLDPPYGYWGRPSFDPAARVGCYFTRVRANNAWRRVQVCY
jgi:hypothetical protein